MMIINIILSVLVLLLNGLDIYLTKLILREGGTEMNPFMRSKYWIAMKIGAAIILIVASWLLHWMILLAPTAIFAGACVWNFIQLKRKD